MFDLDTFIDSCRRASVGSEPRSAIHGVLAEAVSDPGAVATALPPRQVGIERLHVSSRLCIVQFVWAPGLTLEPHDHGTWAAIGLYTGGEDNAFFRRDGASLVSTGQANLRPGDACVLDEGTIHAVTNPTGELAAAIHVYGADLATLPRSQWRGDPRREQPYDDARTRSLFDEANRRWSRGVDGAADPVPVGGWSP